MISAFVNATLSRTPRFIQDSQFTFILSQFTHFLQEKCSVIEVVNVILGGKEKGEVRNPASGKGDMGNSMTDFF